ncbi:MAG: helix-turn-helix transcriptional regulator [bacterium]|nr:helix-turn-helix transcriptional regulator [bacterium]
MSANVHKEIGERLKRIRSALGFNQKDFAVELEISPASLSEIEAGNAKPRYEIFHNLTLKYNVNINFLLHGRGDMVTAAGENNLVNLDKFGDGADFLKKFLFYFEKSEIVRSAIINHLSLYLVRNKKEITEQMNEQ